MQRMEWLHPPWIDDSYRSFVVIASTATSTHTVPAADEARVEHPRASLTTHPQKQ